MILYRSAGQYPPAQLPWEGNVNKAISFVVVIALFVGIVFTTGCSGSPTGPSPNVLAPPIAGNHAILTWQFGNGRRCVSGCVPNPPIMSGGEGQFEVSVKTATENFIFLEVAVPKLSGERLSLSVSNSAADVAERQGRPWASTSEDTSDGRLAHMQLGMGFTARSPGIYAVIGRLVQTGQHPKESVVTIWVTVTP